MISVVIPTRDRRAVLLTTLERLASQMPQSGGVEVVVVDNGSVDDTLDALAFAKETFPVPLTILSEPTPGPAAARNLGVRAASGDIVLFLGDDMEPADDTLLGGHADFHARNRSPEAALLGRVDWHPRHPVTPFMHWLESGGPQFSFHLLSAGPVAAEYFYTSNVSVKRELLLQVGGFDTRFPFAAVEDIEIGMRLAAAGMHLVYDPGLVVLHDHPQEPGAWMARMRIVGQSANLYNTLWPDQPVDGLPRPVGPAWTLSRFVGPLASIMSGLPVGDRLRRLAWRVMHADAYARGYRSGSAWTPRRPIELGGTP